MLWGCATSCGRRNDTKISANLVSECDAVGREIETERNLASTAGQWSKMHLIISKFTTGRNASCSFSSGPEGPLIWTLLSFCGYISIILHTGDKQIISEFEIICKEQWVKKVGDLTRLDESQWRFFFNDVVYFPPLLSHRLYHKPRSVIMHNHLE